MFPSFPVKNIFTGLPQLLKYDGYWLNHLIWQFLWDPQMWLIRSHVYDGSKLGESLALQEELKKILSK